MQTLTGKIRYYRAQYTLHMLWLYLYSKLSNIVIVISEFLERHSKAKLPGNELIHERCDESKGLSEG